MSQRRAPRWSAPVRLLVFILPLVLIAALASSARVAAIPVAAATGTYTNPLPVQVPRDGLVETCADPSLIRGQERGDNYWYMYCTTDPLNGADRNAEGGFNFRLIPILRSLDLVNWTYVGDAFRKRPDWVADTAGLWAPNIEFFNGQYYLYYTAQDTDLEGRGSAIGVATSRGPTGPWTDRGAAVEPHEASCCPGSRRWVYDADVIEVDDQKYIYYGSYFGGISVRKLATSGLESDPASQQQITTANRYEGGHVVQHAGFYYLFAPATDCCRGPLTGYSVFAGRSTSPTGPFVDREGVSLLQGRVGGTPVISMNGNRWVGPGHNFVFEDFAGRWWTVYHAIDRNDPYFTGATGFTKRPVLLDPVDWIDGWPTVRGGLWGSAGPLPAPSAQPGQTTNYMATTPALDQLGRRVATASDEFDTGSLKSRWNWVREPAGSEYGLTGTTFRFDTQPKDLHEGSNNAPVLVEDAPNGNYIVETRVQLNLPAEGCCPNFHQAGLVIYRDDDNYIKLVHVSIWETRQTEFAKELGPVPAGYPRYGNTVVGPPADWTYLRIVKRMQGAEEHYTAYTSGDGQAWVRGGTWTHNLGAGAKIGLVSMGGPDFVANFDYVRVYELAN